MRGSHGRAVRLVHDLVRHRLSHLADTVSLVVSERSTNAVVHAESPITVTLSERDELVTLGVEDDDPADLLVPSAPGPLAEHGYGMNIVAQVSHGWGVSTGLHGGKRVWASFAR